MRRRPLTFGLVFGFALFGSLGPGAHAQDPALVWDILSADERAIVDRLAADFYQESLRRTQADAIEETTSRLYAEAGKAERARFLDERRRQWDALSQTERERIRGVKQPEYRNLTESQKTPFREHAINRLGGAGAIDEDRLAEAFRRDI